MRTRHTYFHAPRGPVECLERPGVSGNILQRPCIHSTYLQHTGCELHGNSYTDDREVTQIMSEYLEGSAEQARRCVGSQCDCLVPHASSQASMCRALARCLAVSAGGVPAWKSHQMLCICLIPPDKQHLSTQIHNFCLFSPDTQHLNAQIHNICHRNSDAKHLTRFY